MKAPPNLPNVGDKVKLRGMKLEGTVLSIKHENNWTRVKWDEHSGPEICHLFELEKISATDT